MEFGDTLLVQARPAGPVCHTGTQTCFGDTPGPDTAFLGALQAMAVSTGFPFTIVLLLMCVSLLIGLNRARKEAAKAAKQS